jgi:hypothetical protein
VSASTKEGAAGKNLEAQRCWLFVSLELGSMARWNSLKRLKVKSTAKKAYSAAKKRMQTEVDRQPVHS